MHNYLAFFRQDRFTEHFILSIKNIHEWTDIKYLSIYGVQSTPETVSILFQHSLSLTLQILLLCWFDTFRYTVDCYVCHNKWNTFILFVLSLFFFYSVSWKLIFQKRMCMFHWAFERKKNAFSFVRIWCSVFMNFCSWILTALLSRFTSYHCFLFRWWIDTPNDKSSTRDLKPLDVITLFSL